jgi:DNA-binding LacI/PurR family transcriptional regulator
LPTVQDVACLAKVSVGSVSSVLIRPDTLHRKAASRDLSNRAAVEPRVIPNTTTICCPIAH